MVKPLIGVLALQGGFAEHGDCLREIGLNPTLVRLPKDLEGLQGLIIPGGESTTLMNLIHRNHLREPLDEAVKNKGLCLWGTCAGAILLGKNISFYEHNSFGYMNMTLDRNAYGAQSASFESEVYLNKNLLGESVCKAVFIRAPRLLSLGDEVICLAHTADNQCVGVQEGRHMATTFHPELTKERCFHNYFVKHCLLS